MDSGDKRIHKEDDYTGTGTDAMDCYYPYSSQ